MTPPLRPRRVLMTTDCVGGVWTYATSLARFLSGKGIAVDLVTLGPSPSDTQRAMVAPLQDVTLHETDLALEWQDPRGDDVARARRLLLGLGERLAPDLVHLNSYREALLDWSAPVVLACHSCVNTWAAACGRVHDFPSDLWAPYTRRIAKALRQADAWIVPSAAFRAALIQTYAPPGDGHVIHNGIVLPNAPPAGKEPFILSAGRMWDRAKGLDTLVEAASSLAWPVKIAGPAPDDVAASGGVELLGTQSAGALQVVLERAAIYASPALYEPFGLAVLEAAASGCALVLSDIPVFRELWEDAAVFVDPGDGAALRAALAQLIADPAERTRLSHAALLRAGHYTMAETGSRTLALYGEVLAGRARLVREPERHLMEAQA